METLYPQFLEESYDSIKSFNKAYGLKLKEFSDFAELENKPEVINQNLKTRMDWLRFKDYYQESYRNVLRDLYVSFSCNPLFLSTVSFRSNLQPPLNDFETGEDEPKILGVSLTWNDTSSDLLQKVRYAAANSDFPFATELSIGMFSPEPAKSKNFFPVSDLATRYLLSLALAGGIKGFNSSMFVERDHWYDAALANDGTIQPSYEVMKYFNAASMKIDFGAFDAVTEIGLVSYKPHSRLELLRDGENLEYIDNLLYSTLPGVGRDLDRLKIDYQIPELTNTASLEKFSTLIIPVSEYMDRPEQELLIEKIKAGVNVIFTGVMPKYDTFGNPCNKLSAFLKIRTNPGLEVAEVKAEDKILHSILYATISSSDSQTKTLAKAGKSVVAVRTTKYGGKVYFISFDLSTQEDHNKMTFLESIIADCGQESFIYTSNPDVRAIVRTDKKRALLFLLYSKPQLPFKKSERHPLQVAVKVDLKKAGIRTARLRMTELFSGEKTEITSRNLAGGFITELRSLDSRVWLIAPQEKKSSSTSTT
jgi:hypothetical protein